MHIPDQQELGLDETPGASFLTGDVISTFWESGAGGVAVEAAAKKKTSKKPKPKPTKGPGCVTKKADSCTAGNC